MKLASNGKINNRVSLRDRRNLCFMKYVFRSSLNFKGLKALINYMVWQPSALFYTCLKECKRTGSIKRKRESLRDEKKLLLAEFYLRFNVIVHQIEWEDSNYSSKQPLLSIAEKTLSTEQNINILCFSFIRLHSSPAPLSVSILFHMKSPA